MRNATSTVESGSNLTQPVEGGRHDGDSGLMGVVVG